MIWCFSELPFCLVTVRQHDNTNALLCFFFPPSCRGPCKLSPRHTLVTYLPAVALGGGGGGGALVHRRGGLVDRRGAPLLRAQGAPVVVLVVGHADEAAAAARHYAPQTLSILRRLPGLSVGFSSGEQGESHDSAGTPNSHGGHILKHRMFVCLFVC